MAFQSANNFLNHFFIFAGANIFILQNTNERNQNLYTNTQPKVA